MNYSQRQKTFDASTDKEKDQLVIKVEMLSNENKVLKKELNTTIVYNSQLF